MNLAIFFEGTGQGVQGRETNVSRMFALAAETPTQLRHLESGPGTHFGAYLFGRAFGVDAQAILSRARRWFEANYRSLPPVARVEVESRSRRADNQQPTTNNKQPTTNNLSTRVYLFGFSRGALLARRFAEWLDKLGIEVAYLGLWDTVDATTSFDVPVECPPNVRRARHAVARDEFRRHFNYVSLKGDKVEEVLFPGSHSDVGGLYEDNHAIADVALAWIAEAAAEEGLEIRRRVGDGVLTSGEDAASPGLQPRFIIHNSLNLVSNLFGLLGRVPRAFGDMIRHPLCEKV